MLRVFEAQLAQEPDFLDAYQRYRRIFLWDMWAHAALAAEDLEILVRAVEGWRAGGDVFAIFRDVDAVGPEFFARSPKLWADWIAQHLRLPAADVLEPYVGERAPELTEAYEKSSAAAAAGLDAMARLVPGLVRQAMLRYKHGFVRLLPSVAALDLDPIGYPIVEQVADRGGFLVVAGQDRAVAFRTDDSEFDEAEEAVEVASGLAEFIAAAVLSEAEGREQAWGIGLYGDAEDDLTTVALHDQVLDALRAP